MKQDGNETAAGIDISIGYGVDSWLSDIPLRDPWSEECVSLFCEAVLNNTSVRFPLPTAKAIANFSEASLPISFARGIDQKLLAPKASRTAEDITVQPDDIAQEYERFLEWAKKNTHNLYLFVQYHFDSGRIAHANELEFRSEYFVGEFWAEHVGNTRPSWWPGDSADLEYAFDVFLRAAQYQVILGQDGLYFPHPVRKEGVVLWSETLSSAPAIPQRHQCFPWGKFFVEMRRQHGFPRDASEFADALAGLRDSAVRFGAVSSRLPTRFDVESWQRIEASVQEARIPGTVKQYIVDKVRTVLTTGSVASGVLAVSPEALTASTIAFLTTTVGLVVAQIWTGEVGGKISSLKALRGSVEYPVLRDGYSAFDEEEDDAGPDH